jgi:hypothetical protein
MERFSIVGESDLQRERAWRGRERVELLLSEPQEFSIGFLVRILGGRYIVCQAASQGGYLFCIVG